MFHKTRHPSTDNSNVCPSRSGLDKRTVPVSRTSITKRRSYPVHLATLSFSWSTAFVHLHQEVTRSSRACRSDPRTYSRECLAHWATPPPTPTPRPLTRGQQSAALVSTRKPRVCPASGGQDSHVWSSGLHTLTLPHHHTKSAPPQTEMGGAVVWSLFRERRTGSGVGYGGRRQSTTDWKWVGLGTTCSWTWAGSSVREVLI